MSELVLLANARMPSERAQSLQVAQMAAAFERAGAPTTLLHARRVPTPPLPPGVDLFAYYRVPPGPRPRVEAVPCADWIDRVPRALQALPARVQELSFAARAVRRVARDHPDALVLCREVEAARRLALGTRPRRVFLELHRVPGGRLRRRWLRAAAPRLGGVVAISGGVREDLAALGVAGERVLVEHDAAPAAHPAARPTRAEARRALDLPADAPVVTYTGGLLAWKGVDVLLGAARRLPDVRFAVAGGMRADVERLRAEARGLPNVRIDGFQPPERVPLYLAAGDVGVVPNRSTPAISARYTSPLKVFEALAAGLPLVASDLPSLREVLAPDVDAVLVPPDDDAALAAGIARLLADEDLRRRLAARGLERAPRHTYDARARRILAWMRERAA